MIRQLLWPFGACFTPSFWFGRTITYTGASAADEPVKGAPRQFTAESLPQSEEEKRQLVISQVALMERKIEASQARLTELRASAKEALRKNNKTRAMQLTKQCFTAETAIAANQAIYENLRVALDGARQAESQRDNTRALAAARELMRDAMASLNKHEVEELQEESDEATAEIQRRAEILSTPMGAAATISDQDLQNYMNDLSAEDSAENLQSSPVTSAPIPVPAPLAPAAGRGAPVAATGAKPSAAVPARVRSPADALRAAAAI
jgi:hypothetical protein